MGVNVAMAATEEGHKQTEQWWWFGGFRGDELWACQPPRPKRQRQWDVKTKGHQNKNVLERDWLVLGQRLEQHYLFDFVFSTSVKGKDFDF